MQHPKQETHLHTCTHTRTNTHIRSHIDGKNTQMVRDVGWFGNELHNKERERRRKQLTQTRNTWRETKIENMNTD